MEQKDVEDCSFHKEYLGQFLPYKNNIPVWYYFNMG